MSSRKDLANAIRALSIDAIQKAQSGHPGTPMGMADIAEVLWRDFLNHNPQNPTWFNRDRFVLSNGHGSMLIYSLLHLTGYDLSIEELKNFRQLNSKTPGHPEVGYTPGVETTTGPLGQGIANAVGMAIAEKSLAVQFNRPGYKIVDHFTYTFMGDGCMMEGISHEVCALAGTLKLGKLIVFYDDNGVSIDGNVKDWFTDDTAKRFKAYDWHVINNIDGHDANSVRFAIEEARKVLDKPSLLICKTIIGFGSPNKAGTHNSHGAPLGDIEVTLTRKQLNWKHEPFEIPPEIYALWDTKESSQLKEVKWNKKFSSYAKKFPQEAEEFSRRMKGETLSDFSIKIKDCINKLQNNPVRIASYEAYQDIIKEFNLLLPELFSGSANLALLDQNALEPKSIINNTTNDYINYGLREFGMIAIANGIALHGGFLPHTYTFLFFAEYARNAVRMAALMKLRQIIIYIQESVILRENYSYIYQLVEYISYLRLTPNISTWRPCDQVETAVAFKYGIENLDGPTVLILSRHSVVQQERTEEQLANISRGGYILKDYNSQPELILMTTGSEVELVVEAWKKLCDEGIKTRIVSMPCTKVFDQQTIDYRESVLPKTITARLAIELGTTDYWFKYVGLNGKVIAVNNLSKIFQGEHILKRISFMIDDIITQAKKLL